MALGDGTAWNVLVPGNSAVLKDGAAEIRDLRKGLDTRLLKEHIQMATTDGGGEHEKGSAKAYSQSGEPTNKANTATALASADAGRLWVDSDDGSIFYYTGTEWLPVLGTILKVGTVTATGSTPSATQTISYPFSIIILMENSLTNDPIGTEDFIPVLTTRNSDETFTVNTQDGADTNRTLTVTCVQTSSTFTFRVVWTGAFTSKTWRYRVIA